jgi:hypothetical protein
MSDNVRISRLGMKVSKKVRKRVKKAVEAAANPFVRDFATAAMAAAGRARRDGNDESRSEGKVHVMCGETRVHIEGSKVAEAFRAAAVDGFRRFLEGLEEGLRKAQQADEPKPKPAARKAKPRTAKAKVKPAAKPRASRSAKRPPRSPGPAA